MAAIGQKQQASKCMIAFFVIGMLISGTLNTLTTKIQFTQFSIDISGEVKQFQKPWFGTWNMMFAMSLVGLVDMFIRRCCMRKGGAGSEPLIDAAPQKANEPSYCVKATMVLIPAVFDLLATALCCIGMLYIPASVWQMLRGSSIVFCAILSIMFLRRKMYAFNWIGLTLCVGGVALVGLANIAGEEEEPGKHSNMILGMSLVILGQVVQAGQVIAEEFLMKDVNLPAMQVIGLEGYWGAACMILVVYPILYALPGNDDGHAEDPFDTAVMFMNSSNLQCVVGLYLISCGTFNATGISVTGVLSGVHRMMLDASRTMVIWAFGLAVHYYYDPNSLFGEVWTQYSYIQLIGFFIIVLGQAIYGEVVKVPGLWYPPVDTTAQLLASPTAALNLASPLPREG